MNGRYSQSVIPQRSEVIHPFNQNSGRIIKRILRHETDRATSHDEVCAGVCKVVTLIRQNCKGVGFMSGIIGSDGQEHIDRNIQMLAKYTDNFRERLPFPVFSAADVFHPGLLAQYRNVQNGSWFSFWRRVLDSGVTDLYMTPRWEASIGALDEHAFCKEVKPISVHYVHEDEQLLGILKNGR